MQTVVTRFPPSPTGYLHIGGARTALFNWLLARSTGGRFVLRMEDTDVERSSREMTDSILEAMHWLGLDWDEGPYYQSQRFDLYQRFIDELLDNSMAYYCSCTPEEVEQMREEARKKGEKPKYNGRCRERNLGPGPERVIRFKSPLEGETAFKDVLKGDVAVDNRELDDFVLRRTDGAPTYNLAVVVDDVDMGITHILRGDDHLSNTPKQVLLYRALGVDLPVFGHVPMIMGPDKKRLSKRHGAMSVLEYRRQGFLPEAMSNYLARLGWSYGDQEIFSQDELREKFSLHNLSKSACVFDPDKLLWVNSQHIKSASAQDLAPVLQEFLAASDLPSPEQDYLLQLIPLLQPRAKTMQEMAEWAAPFVRADGDLPYDPELLHKFLTPEAASYLERLLPVLRELPRFDQKSLESRIGSFLEEQEIRFKRLAQPIRVALTGSKASPGLFESMELLGRESVLARLERALQLAEA
ncbi:MAG: glutamate--tRNA ligase [Desulfohalobiaceae bacterium]|nr:glutamate--tRNA ligase [Desulfohalobiaceae bacterium]